MPSVLAITVPCGRANACLRLSVCRESPFLNPSLPPRLTDSHELHVRILSDELIADGVPSVLKYSVKVRVEREVRSVSTLRRAVDAG